MCRSQYLSLVVEPLTDYCRRAFSFHAYNIGHLSSRASEPLFTPCTPTGVIHLLDSTGVKISGSRAVVLGRSDIVGSPVAAMLRHRDATVTQCHSRTQNLPDIVRLRLVSPPRNCRLTHYSHVRSRKRILSSLPSGSLSMCRAHGSSQALSLSMLARTTFQVSARSRAARRD